MYFRPVFFDQLDDLPALVDRGRHRHGAHDVLAGLEGGDRHRRVIGNRRVDVDEIDLRVRQHVLVLRVALLDLEGVADLR